MPNLLLLFTAIAFYGVSSYMLCRSIQSKVENTNKSSSVVSIRKAFTFGCIGAVCHLLYAYRFSLNDGQLDIGLSSMSVLVSALLTLIFILGTITLPIRRLGVLVFPLVSACLIFAQLWKSEPQYLSTSSTFSGLHIIVSIIAYSLLAIAAIQALLYQYQENQFKNKASPAMLAALPPLQTMETLLFRLIWTGFILLSLTLVSGVFFSHEIYAKPFEFNHHTILASLGWLVYAILLVKRLLNGLRGTQAVIWTISGFVLIQLGYFGTKVVLESLAVQ